MKRIPLYDLGNETEVMLLVKKHADNTPGSTVGLPDRMILFVGDNSIPAMTLEELNDWTAFKRGAKNGVMAE